MSKFLKSNSAKVVLGLAAFAFAFAGVGTAQAYTFTAPTLKMGSKSEAVRELQKALNMCSDTMVATSGAGSIGFETVNYAGRTRAAVKAWQTKMSLTSDGIFGPMSRAKMNAEGCGSGSTTPPPTQTGPISASLSTSNPMSGTLVAGQATADLAHFTFTGTGVVTGVTLQRIGVSADSTPSNVFLFDGAMRLTDAASVSSNGTVTFNNPAGIFTVMGMKNVKVKADIASGTSGQTVGMMLKSFTTAGGTVSPMISGNIHTVASATLAGVSAGTVTPSGATINPGSNVTLWQSTLTVSNRDVMMKRLALRNIGSAPASSFQNFKLYINGVQVATSAGMDSMGYVTFDMSANPVTLVAGARVARVDADVVSGASRTVQLSLRQAADVDFVDSSFGVNIVPTSTPWAPSSASTIAGTAGGTLTIEKDISSPSTNLVNNGSDVNLGTFKFTAYGEPIKVETLLVGGTFDGTQGSTNNAAVTLRNGRVLINGVQYGSTATIAPAGTTFTTNYTIMPGTPVMVEVHADIYDNDGTGALDASDTILASILAGTSNAQRVDSLGSFNAPSATVSANTLTIGSTSMTLAKNNTYADQTLTVPQTNYKIGAWNLSGSSIEDILLTTMSFDIDEAGATADFDEEDLTNMYAVVKVGGAVVYTTSPVATLSTDGQDNNFSLNYTLAKNTSAQIELFANISDTGTPSAIDTGDKLTSDLTVTGTSLIGGSSVTATSADTAGQTLTIGTASITATTDPSTPVAAIVTDNQTVTTAAFKVAAVTSSYNVTDVVLTLGSATVASMVHLYDGGTLIASRPAATTVNFNGLNWSIPANTNKVLTVKVDLGTVADATSDGTGSTAGSALLTTLTSFLATNTSTGVNAAGTESNPAGSAMYAYAATPTVTSVALPSTTLAAGTNTFAKFTVASNGGSIAWKKIIFTISRATTGAAVANTFTLWDENNNQVAGTATLTDGGDNDCGDALDTSCTVAFVATAEQGISGTKTYSLKGSVSGVLTDNDYFSTSIAQPSSFVATDDYTAVAGTSATFVWSDLTGNGHDAGSTTVTDWNNGYLVKFLPLDGQTLTY